ncbi:unnamed protein product, partial [Allacma fusca]
MKKAQIIVSVHERKIKAAFEELQSRCARCASLSQMTHTRCPSPLVRGRNQNPNPTS